MVIVSQGKASIRADSVDLAMDIITFIGSVNELKKRDYEKYKMVECTIQELVKEEPFTVDIIKEFALNMTEIFS